MKERRLETLFVMLLQAHGQRELLVRLLTRERLRDVQVYQDEERRLRHRRRGALRELACWLDRMGLQEEMVRLLQDNSCKRPARWRQTQRERHAS